MSGDFEDIIGDFELSGEANAHDLAARLSDVFQATVAEWLVEHPGASVNAFTLTFPPAEENASAVD